MDPVRDDVLGVARDALARHDWPAALAAAQTAPADSRALEAERADLAAEAAWWLGRLDECITAREQAYRIFEELGETRRAGQCAVWLWEHHNFVIRPAIAGAWLRRAQGVLAGDTECVEYGALRLREAETAHGAGDLEQAISLANEVIVLAKRLRSANLEAEALQTRGRLRIGQGRLVEGMGDLDEAMLFAVEGRLGPYSTGKVYCSLISACEEVGDIDRAAEWTEATLTWAEQHPFAIFPGICRVHRAMVLKQRGSLAQAEREAMLACDELAHSHIANSAAAYAEVGDIRRRLGEFDRAAEAFAKAQELCGQPCGGLALLHLAQGRIDTAMTVITGCLRDTTNPLGRAALLPMFVHVTIAAGELDPARDAIAELEAIAATFDSPVLRATLLSTRGRLQVALRDPDACDTLHAAWERWSALDVPYEMATARTLLGEALRIRGDEAGAANSFAVGAKLFDQIGARLDSTLSSGRQPELPAGLTPREAEILRLVAAGLTNNDIAARLFLSPKTVSRHLSNIFTKIGVSSRASATAFAFEHAIVEGRH